MRMVRRYLLGVCVGAVSVLTVTAQAPPPAFIHTNSPHERIAYLAHAVIWRDPGPLTPEQIRFGPAAAVPDSMRRASAGTGVECRYDRPGSGLGGRTPKFVCRTAEGGALRVKYYDVPATGNREVFASVAATRLTWALGFDADPVFPIALTCVDCPLDPSTGRGPAATRRYAAIFEPRFAGTIIASKNDPEQGWTFGELDDAIDTLTDDALRARQRMHFDALSLLGVFLGHGDRKSSQQRLVCRGDLDMTAGDVHDLSSSDEHNFSLTVLFERPGARACRGESVVTLQDIGATYGSAGRTTPRVHAKVHLESWASRPVFAPPATSAPASANTTSACRGNLTVSMAAGSGARGMPTIGEAGREFLLTQLNRLSADHVRAIFEVARVDQMGEVQTWTDRAGKRHSGIDAWVAVFADKVRQIKEKRCAQ
jgi:hypothetical protein